jgi:hypothetical protein
MTKRQLQENIAIRGFLILVGSIAYYCFLHYSNQYMTLPMSEEGLSAVFAAVSYAICAGCFLGLFIVRV